MAALSRALEFALAKAGRDCDFQLKPEQKEIIDAVVCRKKDVLGILRTGFGKSLVFHFRYLKSSTVPTCSYHQYNPTCWNDLWHKNTGQPEGNHKFSYKLQ